MPFEKFPKIFKAGIYRSLYESKAYWNIYPSISALFTLYILDLEPSVMCEIVHIMSASIYLLLVPFKAPLLMTLHKSGQAYFMYFCSGGGCPLHKLVIAHAPFLICNLS